MYESRILKIGQEQEPRVITTGDVVILDKMPTNLEFCEQISKDYETLAIGSKLVIIGFDDNLSKVKVFYKGFQFMLDVECIRYEKDESVIDTIRREADETSTMFSAEDIEFADRKIFVSNLGWLLAQTRERIEKCDLDDDDNVIVSYKDGNTRQINVKHDSYAAILKDVINKCF